MAQALVWLVRRQIYTGIHSGRRLEEQYWTGMSGDGEYRDPRNWSRDRTLAVPYSHDDALLRRDACRHARDKAGVDGVISHIIVPL